MTFIVDVKVTGIDGIGQELLRDARAVAKSTLSKASTPLARRYRQKLSRRGPPRPGEPPARVTGALRSTVGKSAPKVDRDGDVVVHVGIGEGRAKARRVAELKTGVIKTTLGGVTATATGKGINVFEYALLLEHGGIGAGGRRYPPYPYARPAEEESVAEISAILERELG